MGVEIFTRHLDSFPKSKVTNRDFHCYFCTQLCLHHVSVRDIPFRPCILLSSFIFAPNNYRHHYHHYFQRTTTAAVGAAFHHHHFHYHYHCGNSALVLQMVPVDQQVHREGGHLSNCLDLLMKLYWNL